ncbi:MAG TPA: hypothetical protein VHG32_01515 [Thermoanaerobaculia bacterium]|jgi:hypothetical protein|nr:hypothetical protein [Thermoanaerobaculia bacterium]
MSNQTISVLTGAATIFFSFVLLYLKRISLTSGSGDFAVDLGVMKVSSTGTALGLFLIGLILILVPVMGFPPRPSTYRVNGRVQLSDPRDPRLLTQVQIFTQYPPLTLTGNGEIMGLQVWRDPDGNLPFLGFSLGSSHPDFSTEGIDLNQEATIAGGVVTLKTPVTLKSLGGAK